MPPDEMANSPDLRREFSANGRLSRIFKQEVASLDSRLQRFRVPPADRLRVIRTFSSNENLTTIVHEAESRNQMSWTPDGIVLMAEFKIDGGDAILPSFWIQADPVVMDRTKTMRMHFT